METRLPLKQLRFCYPKPFIICLFFLSYFKQNITLTIELTIHKLISIVISYSLAKVIFAQPVDLKMIFDH